MPVVVPQRLRSGTLGRHGILDVVQHDVVDPDGSRYPIVCLQMPDWVTIVPFTPEGRIVLVRQYRHGVEQTMLETPGGVVDPGESPGAAAVRELREETGYLPGRWVSLGSVYPNPAIQNNRLHMMLAEDVSFVGMKNPDEHEHTETVVLDQAAALEQLRAGQIHNALSALALERAFSQTIG